MYPSTILDALRTKVLADSTAHAFYSGNAGAGDAAGLLAYLNGASASTAWKPIIVLADMFASLTISTYDNVAGGKRDAFSLCLRMAELGLLNATKASCRTGFADIFAVTGTYTDAAQLAKMLNGACTELATRAEVLFGFTTPAAVGGVTAIKRTQILSSLDITDCTNLIYNADGTIRTV